MTDFDWAYRLMRCDCNGGRAASASPTATGLEPAWRQTWRAIQTALRDHGFDPGPIDGIRGDRTDAAIRAFKRSRQLRDRAYVGEITLTALMGDRPAPEITPPRDGEPEWMEIARSYLGMREIAGPHHHPKIVEWWADIGASWFDDDETPWCGAFVGGVLFEAGIAIPSASEAPRARAWQHWGVGLRGPAVGAIASLWRGSRHGSAGHVGFVAGRTADGSILLLGGNQGDAVTIAAFEPDRVLAYSWPIEAPLPAVSGWDRLPVYGGDNKIVRSTNEA